MKLSEKIAKAIDEFVLCGGDIDMESLITLIEPHTAQLGAEDEALRLKAKHTVQSVNTIRGVMRINLVEKGLGPGQVFQPEVPCLRQ